MELGGPLERQAVRNTELPALRIELEQAKQDGKIDSFDLYLLGVVLQALEAPEAARAALIQSVSAYPLNWSAWQALASLCRDKQQVPFDKYSCHVHERR